MLPGGGGVRQPLTQAGHFVLQASYHGVFVLRFQLKIRESADFFSQQQNDFILGEARRDVTRCGSQCKAETIKKNLGKTQCNSFGKVRAAGREKADFQCSVTWKTS